MRDCHDGEFIEQDDTVTYGDNANPITLNAYIYGDGDPVNNRDPSGHYANSQTYSSQYGGAWAAVGGVVADETAESFGEGVLADAVGGPITNTSNEIIDAATLVTSTWLPETSGLEQQVTYRGWSAFMLIETAVEASWLGIGNLVALPLAGVIDAAVFGPVKLAAWAAHKITGKPNIFEQLPWLTVATQRVFNEGWSWLWEEFGKVYGRGLIFGPPQ
jgi:hypothetical protein